MAKRKAKELAPSDSVSSLSPPPLEIEGELEEEHRPPKRRQTRAPAAKKETVAASSVGRGSSKGTPVKRGKDGIEQHVKVEEQEEAEKPQAQNVKGRNVRKTRSEARGKDIKVEDKEEQQQAANEGGKDSKVQTTPTRGKKRKTKAEREAEAMPLAARTAGHKFHIGAHVSSAGGVHNCVANGLHIGANAFALFLRSQRKWANPPLAPDVRDQFLDRCKAHSYDQAKHVVPHGSYLVNLAHTDAERTEQAYASFVDDLKRCRELGIRLYNFHPGNCGDRSREESIRHLAGNINRAHRDAGTGGVVALLENMASAGEGSNVIGGRFEDLRDVIALVEDKERVGVCLDTCHAFAAGYDLRSKEAFQATMKKLEEVVGLKYLRAVHINDSKAPLGSYRDLHANIGTGFLGLRAFYWLMNDKRFEGLPLVLETPIDVPDESKLKENGDGKGKAGKEKKTKSTKEDKGVWAREIKLLESLVGMDIESEEFKSLEDGLAKKGAVERDRIMEQVERKKEKDKSKGTKKKGKKRKTSASSDGESSSQSELEEAQQNTQAVVSTLD